MCGRTRKLAVTLAIAGEVALGSILVRNGAGGAQESPPAVARRGFAAHLTEPASPGRLAEAIATVV